MALAIVISLSMLLCSCNKDDKTDKKYVPDEAEISSTENMDFSFSERDVSAEYSDKIINVHFDEESVSYGEGCSLENGALTIMSEGTYILSGNGESKRLRQGYLHIRRHPRCHC